MSLLKSLDVRLLACTIIFMSFWNYVPGQASVDRTSIEEALVQYKSLDNDPQLILLEGSLQKSKAVFGLKDTTTIKVLKELGSWHFANRNFEKALVYNQQELTAHRKLGQYPLETATACTRMANIYKWLYDFEKANDYYLQSIALIQDANSPINFENYLGMAITLYTQSNYSLQIDYAKLALILADTAEETCDAYFYMFQGYARLRDKKECARVADLCIQLAKSEKLDFHLGRAYTNLAWLRILEKDYTGAIAYYDKGINFMSKSDYDAKHRNLAYSFSTMSNVYRILNNPEKSIQYAKKAIAENKAFYTSTYHPDLARMYHNLASKYMWQDDYEAGLRHEQKAIMSYIDDESFSDSRQAIPADKLYKVSIKRDLLVSLSDKALCYAALYLNHGNREDLVSAERNIENAVELIDIMRSELSTKNTKMFWRKRTRRIYDYAVELSDWLEDKEKMLRYMEKSRSLLLMDELNHQDALGMLPESLRQREKSLRDAFADSEESDVVKFQAYNGFLDSLKMEFPSYYKYKFDVVTPSIDEIQADILTDSSNVLQYYLTADSLYCLNITNKNVELHTSPRPNDLEEKTKRLLSLVNNKDSLEYMTKYVEFRELSTYLHKVLYEPIIHKRKQAIIIGDGIINYLPFDLLIDDASGRDKYLIEDHVFSKAPSLTVLNVNRKKPENNFGYMLMVCPEEFPNLNLSTLSQSQDEINTFKEITDTEVLSNEQATLAHFKERSEDFSIIHFSSHSGIDKETKMPWIAFSDSLINLNEIYKLNLSASLVTLSSCKSFDGANNTSEGVNSIARAFLFANASAVVGSLWDLNESAGYEIIHQFYKGLKVNLDKPNSLREAKLNYIKNHPHKSPYYWASLEMIGDPRGLDTKVSQSNLGWLILLLLIGLLLIVIKKRGFVNRKKEHARL